MSSSAVAPVSSCWPLEASPPPPLSLSPLQRRAVTPARKHLGASCLRRVSAYSGGFKDCESEMRSAAKKSLSFADQHGSQLVLEHWFFCHEPPTPSFEAATSENGALLPSAADMLTQQQLLSMCVASCSFLGCVLLGYRHFVK